MTIEFIATDAAPKAIGPYSQGTIANGFIFTAGQIALDPATMEIVTGDVKAQTERVMTNLQAVLQSAGSSLSQVVKTTVFLKNMSDFAAMNAIYALYLAPAGTVPPARSTVAVAGLPKDALVEIELIAKESAPA